MAIIENVNMLRCPVCGSDMEAHNQKSIICNQRHCFDLAKNGYINFLQQSSKTEYDKEQFKARNIICKSGFFAPLERQIGVMIERNIDPDNADIVRILDAGCGEGSHLARIINLVHKNFPYRLQGTGLDISKAGIQMAAKKYPSNSWCVGDLASTPFKENTFDVILNILSPANYAEFNRIIKPHGTLLKVVPQSNYLQELRTILFDKTDKQTYSNENVKDLFVRNFNITDEQPVTYQIKMETETLEHIIKMTPLGWHATEENINQILNSNLDIMTVDLVILCGKMIA